MSASLLLSGIEKSFGATPVLRDIELDVQPGEFVSLVGPSGCGKSTLLRIVAGLEIQDRGAVVIGGRPVDALEPAERNVAMVFQTYALYPHMTAFDNIAVPLTMQRLSLAERLPLVKHLSPRRRRIRTEIAREVETVAAQLRIQPLLQRKPSQLSGGQRQRVALARAMVRQPSVFLMDEPLSNLDAQLRTHMRAELAELHRRLGATILYVTHDHSEAMTLSGRVALMDAGRILQFGTPAELYARPATLAVARFIGTPSINVLSGRTDNSGRLSLGGRKLPLTIPSCRHQAVSVAIRPEALAPASPRDLLPSCTLTGTVSRSEFHGAEWIASIRLDEAGLGSVTCRVAAEHPAAARLGEDAPVLLPLAADRLHLFDENGNRLEPAQQTSIASRVAAPERAQA